MRRAFCGVLAATAFTLFLAAVVSGQQLAALTGIRVQRGFNLGERVSR
jgi:hypothetical protein